MKHSVVGLVLQSLAILTAIQHTSGLNSTSNHSEDVKGLPNPHDAPVFSNSYTKPIIVFVLIFVGIIALLNNALIIHVVRVNPHMRTSTNYIIVNMACGDLMAILVSVPGAIYYLHNGQEWGRGIERIFLCKVKYFFFYVSLFCSIFSLVAISFDRFMAVVRPLTYTSKSMWRKMTLPVVWIASLALPCHYAFNQLSLEEYNQKFYCTAPESPGDAYMFLGVGYFVPHIIMVALYVIIAIKLCRRRIPGEPHPSHPERNSGAQKTAKKVTYMIVCIIVAFDLCWAPMFFLHIGPYLKSSVFKYNTIASMASKILMISNGISNALIYAIFNENFRRAFQQALLCKPLMSALRNNRFKTRKVNDSGKAQMSKNILSGQTLSKVRSDTLITRM